MLKTGVQKKDVGWMLALAVLGVVSRWPWISETFYYVDKVYYVHALKAFCPPLELPNPSGYILWIFLAKLISPLTDSPYHAFVALSVLSSGLCAAMLYLIGKEWWNRKVGVGAALLFLTSPLVWFHGEVGFSYLFVAFLSLCLVWMAGQARSTSQGRWAYWGSFVYAIVGGVRPQDLPLLFVVWVYILHHVSWKQRALAFGLWALVMAYWFIPLMQFSGGVSGYVQSYIHGESHILSAQPLAILQRIGGNIEKYTKFMVRGLGLALPLLGYVAWGLRHRWRQGVSKNMALCALWLAPSLLFFLLIYLGNPGHMFASYMLYFLVAAYGLERLLHGQSGWWLMALSVVALVHTMIFFYDAHPTKPWKNILWWNSSDIQHRTGDLLDKAAYIREHFDPKTTLIVGDMGGRGHIYQLAYHLPEFRCESWPLGVSPAERVRLAVMQQQQSVLYLQVSYPIYVGDYCAIIFLDKDEIAKATSLSGYRHERVGNTEIHWVDTKGCSHISWDEQKFQWS